MARKEHTARYTDEELRALQREGKDRSDWKRAAAMTQADIEAAIASDPDEADMAVDWESATVELPQPKAVLNMRIDRDVLDYFRRKGKGYQTLINAVLRAYVRQKEHPPG